MPELGMYYYKARMMSPTLGRFMQTDPIGYKDNVNLYAYVANDPVDKVDYTGMQCAGSATAVSAGGGSNNTVVYSCSDNTTTVRAGGSRAWRDNNSGNVVDGKFSKQEGSIGSAGGPKNDKFAVFPTKEKGQAVLTDLLHSKPVQERTVAGEISKYAPPADGNNTKTYQQQVTNAVGVPATTPMSSLTPAQMSRVQSTIETREGWQPGTETHIKNEDAQ